MRQGFLVILSAPSGAGKSTLCRELVRRDSKLRYSVSVTTRLRRPGERHGKHYFFTTPAQFRKKIRRGEFLEWARVHGHYYGTPKEFVGRWTRKGHPVLLAVDVQGALAIRRQRKDCVLIFIRPPSRSLLRERLFKRKDDKASVSERLHAAGRELKSIRHYDYTVVNDELHRAVRDIRAILTAEILKTSRGAVHA